MGDTVAAGGNQKQTSPLARLGQSCSLYMVRVRIQVEKACGPLDELSASSN